MYKLTIAKLFVDFLKVLDDDFDRDSIFKKNQNNDGKSVGYKSWLVRKV